MAPTDRDPRNPMENTFANIPIPRVSTQQFCIAGILVTVYGLRELKSSVTEVAVLWLLHPRLECSETMAPLAALFVDACNERAQFDNTGKQKCLIAVSFDLRNHGRRRVSAIANEVWNTGNSNHAKDLCSICEGTVADVSLLISYLPPVIFPYGSITVSQHICCGVSLGGHITWQLLAREARITTYIVLLGCADLVSMLQDRARLSKVPDYINTTPPGKDFLGSPSFPCSLVKRTDKFNAAQIIMGSTYGPSVGEPIGTERLRLQRFYDQQFQGKCLLVVSGGSDRMAPYAHSLPTIDFLRSAVSSKAGWWKGGQMSIKAVVAPGIRHELTVSMVNEALDFLLKHKPFSTAASSIALSRL